MKIPHPTAVSSNIGAYPRQLPAQREQTAPAPPCHNSIRRRCPCPRPLDTRTRRLTPGQLPAPPSTTGRLAASPQDVGPFTQEGRRLPSSQSESQLQGSLLPATPAPRQLGAFVNPWETKLGLSPPPAPRKPAHGRHGSWVPAAEGGRLAPQLPPSQAWPAWPQARHLTSPSLHLIARRSADAATSLRGPGRSGRLPLLRGSITAGRSEVAKPGCRPAPSPPRPILKIKTSFHLSWPRERRRQKEVCCQYMKLSLSKEKKNLRGRGGMREGTKPHFYFWWPAS